MDTLENVAGVVRFATSVGQQVNFADWLTTTDVWVNAVNNVFDEWRPVRVRVQYVPLNRYTGSGFPMLLVYDNDGGLPVTPTILSYSAYRTAKLVTTTDPFELEYEWSPPARDLWFNVNNPTAWTSELGLCVTTAVGSTNPQGVFYFEVELEARGVRG
jgi:hypothetical protein